LVVETGAAGRVIVASMGRGGRGRGLLRRGRDVRCPAARPVSPCRGARSSRSGRGD